MRARTCKHCASPLRRKAKSGPWPRYCSATCRARASDARAVEDGRADQWLTATRTRKRTRRLSSQPSITCPVCATWFTPLRKGKVYCSDACRNRGFRLRRTATPDGRARLDAYEQTRRARKLGDVDARPFDARDVFERDGWVCGLCHEPIPQDAPPRDPLSASLDHVVPLSLGGSHTPENTQASHLICNSRKGNRLAA